MPLIDPLPKPLEEKLAPVIESKDVAAAVFTDLDPSGRFGEEWLVLTPTRLSVYVSNGNGFAPRVELNLEEIKAASADALVDGGALLATVDGKSVFTTRNLRENVQQPAPGRIILNDVDGNRYDIRNVGDLSRESQELLFRHM